MTTTPTELYPEHSIVTLKDAWVSHDGKKVPAGATGVIVSVYEAGSYAVEADSNDGPAMLEVAHGDVTFVKAA